MPQDSNANDRSLSRRELIGATAAVGLGSLLNPRMGAFAATPARRDLIRDENARPGTSDWRLTDVWIDPRTKYRSPRIEGYASRTSLRAGESLRIMVSTNPASSFVIDVFRLGYYGGLGGRFLQRFGPFPGKTQPDPEVGEERLRECRWEPAVEFAIPSDWPSGVYVGKLTAERGGFQSYVIFIVRDDRACDFLFQCADTTWSAYNRWPDQWALYDDGKNEWYLGPRVRVSWDRPYGKYCQVADNPLATGTGSFMLWEFPLSYWLEKEGYDVSYISTVDTHTDAPGLMRARGFLSVGHDEYWSREMYENIKGAIASGLSVAFLSSDTCWGLIPFLPSGAGAPHRVISRLGQFGPLEADAVKAYPELSLFEHLAPTEADIIGARNVYPYSGGADWICSAEKHWLFAGTGMKDGDGIPGLVGFEWMGAPADIPGLDVVARGRVSLGGVEREYTATLYPGPKDNVVFNASTIWWADGLSAPPGYVTPSAHGATPKGPDPRVQRITANLLRRMRGV
ncbi:N,N-dimethylformamidase beta subunit family domain-containing protein [Singulisphaera sp. PoT]|uniref:N,N-dimethylformamidase beta subunit family domain-containing protein n=1 Tax=Singulisphaera sp. PoT TaxID=3411797 RepID=UPI003BF4B387